MFAFSPRTTVANGESDCSAFRISVNGRTFSGDVRTTIPASHLGDGRMTVRGEYVQFGVDLNTFTVRNYTLRGMSDGNGLTDENVVLFAQKRPLHGRTLTGSLSVRLDADGDLTLRRGGSGNQQTMKIQAKNCSQGGIFQMETEPGTRYAHTLGSDMQYCRPERVPAEVLLVRRDTRRNAAGDFLLIEDSLIGRESRQAARLTSLTDAVSRWRVDAGGRMGMVLGEDAFQSISLTQATITCRPIG